MPDEVTYRSRAVRALVLLHEEQLRRFVGVWRRALAAEVRLPTTDDPDYVSLGALGRHLLRSAGGYMVWMCEMLELPDPGIRPAPDADGVIREAEDYMEHVLERWRAPLREVSNDQLGAPEYAWRSGARYCIDAMLEHAVMHPIRHSFQLEELMKGR